MARIALLVPNDELFRLTHDVLQEQKRQLFLMKVIRSERAVMEARQAISQGAEIIIARGLQATIIKQYTDIPVVEISLTRQGVRDLLERAKRILRKENPHIALVTFKNMACDMTGLDRACGVQLHEYLIQNPELLQPTALQAIEDKADLIIGGQTVLELADAAGIPSLFLTNTQDAVEEAIREAFRLAEAFDHGETAAVRRRQSRSGAGSSGAAREAAFVNFPYCSRRMQAAVTLAEQLSATDCPKLLIEPVGTLHRAFAHAMHNRSKHSQEKLVVYDCVPGESSYEALFGRGGKANEAAKGTLEINYIEYLDIASQRKLPELLMFRNVIAVSGTAALQDALIPALYARLQPFSVRIPPLMETPEEIPYLIDVYMQQLPERCGRYHVLTKEAVKVMTAFPWPGGRIQLESFLERLVITADHRSLRAEEVTALYAAIYGEDAAGPAAMDSTHGSEPGRMTGEEAAAEPSVCRSVQALERERIVHTLAECMGSREKTAEKLGISKTTLWRKLKAYGIA